MKVTALIPARYEASRFPGKLLAKLKGKSVILRTYQSAVAMNLFDKVVVVTDSDIIADEIKNNGGDVYRSKSHYISGTDRIAEAASNIDSDIFINIQGDEPFVSREPLAKLIDVFNDESIKVASLIQKIHDLELVKDPNYVKVAVDKNMNTLYFSRAPIPYIRDNYPFRNFYEHIGVYAFRKEELMKFSELEPTELELAEKVEPLRFLENGIQIKMVLTDYMGVEIDTPDDLLKAEKYMNDNNLE